VSLVRRLAQLREEGGRAVLFTVVEGDGVGAKALVVEGAETLGDGVPEEALAQFDELIRRGRSRLVEADRA
jgi:xanthine/CO dehydrogenase XdhC/CoxF family maturation factor